MDGHEYYAILGVDPMCSDEDLRSAFRRRAKELHPDAETGSVEGFLALKQAFDALSDPALRRRYDRVLRPRRRRRPALEPLRPHLARRRYRIGGMSVGRMVGAFVFMAGLSLGAMQVLISDSDVSIASIFGFGSTMRGPARTAPEPANAMTAAKSIGAPASTQPADDADPAQDWRRDPSADQNPPPRLAN